MGISIAEDRDRSVAFLYDNTSMWAFGPAFHRLETPDLLLEPEQTARMFIAWSGEEDLAIRSMDPQELMDAEDQFIEWVRDNPEQAEAMMGR